jgi:4-amino-4-deoxy-L-arabinose transferase-like glycosyltransferase
MTVPVEVRPPAPIAPSAPPNRLTRRLSPTNWALLGLLLTTAVLYLWNLSASGWANAFYSAAAQAGADNWTSFLFGSSDMANSITVDKPPAAIWVMALSVKALGLSSWNLLVPQALMGVGSVWLLFATVRRWYGDAAGLFAGAILALMPAATLMFRFNNPDALLVLLLVGAVYCVVRGIESARTRWLVVAGALIGFAFLTKSMQAFLVLPGFVLAYAVAAPTSWASRLRDLVVAFAAMVVAGGWWVALVEVWPADSRPYIGGSQTNSVLDLILGYNGLGRITGDEAGSVVPGGGTTGGAGGAGGMWGETGIGRLFDGSWAGAIAWLLPAAVVMLAIGVFLTRGEARTGRRRAGLIIWGGWLLVTWLTFSFAGGIIHEYYAVALAPAIGAVVAAVATMLWERRDEAAPRYLLAAVTTAAVLYAAWLLTRAGGWYVTAGAALATAGVLIGLGIALLPQFRPASRWIALAAVASVLVGPLLFSVQTAATPLEGSLPTAGPVLSGSRTGPGGGGPGPGGGPGANGGTPPAGLTAGAGGMPAGGPGGGGGLLNASAPSAELVDVLTADAGDYTWIAAAVGSQNGAGYQLATGYSVMPIGGFNGSDPSPTLAQFKEYVAAGRIHYFIAGGMGGPGGMGGSSGSSAISNWVQEHFTATTVGDVTLYDLTESA